MTGYFNAEELLTAAVPQALGTPAARLRYLYIDSWRRDLANVTVLVFEADSDLPSAVAKLAHGAGLERLATERRNLEILSGSGGAKFRHSVPRPLAFVEREDFALLLETVVPGEPVARVRGLLPERLIALACEWLLDFHEALGGLRFDRAAHERCFERPVERYLEMFRPKAQERAYLARLVRDAEGLIGTDLPLYCDHADFCPANLYLDASRISVIDWETPLVHRLPGFDLIHLLACIGFDAEPGEGSGAFESTFLREGPTKELARQALRRYAHGLGLDPGALALCFGVYWVEYALEKLALGPQAKDDEPLATTPEASQTLRLASFQGGTCRNLEMIAAQETRLPLP